VGSYPTAAEQQPPTGADGAQVAFLFNDGGSAELVSATQLLEESVVAGRSYALTVAIGKVDPDQPFYLTSTYGGYRIELLAGTTVIASDTNTVDPPMLEFLDAVALAPASSIAPGLVGKRLSIRLSISATEPQRMTHFDDVRLGWSEPARVPSMGLGGATALAFLLIGVVLREHRGRRASGW
jgi:hypothetical protein